MSWLLTVLGDRIDVQCQATSPASMEKLCMKSGRSCPKLFAIPRIRSGGLRAEIPGAHAIHVVY
jgi:hypothetical protein